MKTIIRLARLELSILFYSPIAWLVLVVFSFQSGLAFTDKLKLYVGWQEAGSRLSFITNGVFAGPTGVFAEIQKNVFLYIPLLTMGLMSRETSSGSIKLLLSSPVKLRAIVMGKYLAMMVYCLLLIGILALFAGGAAWSISAFDGRHILSALIGIYLLICAYAAIGLFMSSLTSYQVVAAVSTLVVLAALNYIGLLWQSIDFIRDITYFLSISGRADQMRDGLITSKDVAYFILVIVLFLGLTVLLLQGARTARPLLVKAGRYIFFVVSILLAGYFSSRPKAALYLDMTATQANTLTPATQQIIGALKQPLKVTTYVNLLDDFWYMGIPAARNKDITFWAPYQRFMPDMQLGYVYYYDSTKTDWLYKYNPGLNNLALAKKMAKARELDLNMFMPPAAIRKIIDLRPEENRFVRCLEYNGKRSFLREYAGEMNPNPGEAEFAAAIKRLMVTPPKIAFLTGNNERSIDRAGDKDYQSSTVQLSYRKALLNQGFDILQLTLESEEVPAEIAALVIADPKKAISSEKLDRLRRYIDRGGNLLIAGEPGRQSLLNSLLSKLGVQLMDGILLQQSRDFSPDLVTGYFTPAAAATGKSYQLLWKDSSRVSVPGAVGIQYNNTGPYKPMPVLVTDEKKSWNKLGVVNQDTGYVQFDPLAGDKKLSVPVAVALTRKMKDREQRILVTGDADWMSAAELGRYNIRVANFLFMMEVFKWLTYDQFPVDVSRPSSADNKMAIGKEGIITLKIIFLGILPALLLLSGLTILILRKRR
ncbi:MAG TPA: Gldg family protein [Niastella sp.]